MTDVLRFSKKAFTWSVVALTILWSMGVAALVPLTANAAACVLETGDLFKVSGTSAVYYVNSAGKRVPFFHANHFKTLYQDYSGVVECDASATTQYPLADTLPTTVNMRGGELFKLTSEAAVYAVMTRVAGDTDFRAPICQIGSEASASALGYNLRADVYDLPDYLMGNYRKTGLCADGPVNGMLVTKPGSNDVYLVNEGKLSRVDGSLPQFLAKEVRQVTTGFAMGEGSVTPATIVEKSLPLAAGTSGGSGSGGSGSGGTTTTTPSTTAGVLTVSLAADTPAAASVVTDGTYGAQAMIPVLKVNMVATSGDVKVTSLKFSRGGISADTEINNGHLYVGDTWVASNPSIASGVLTFSNASGLFTVAAGSSQTLTLKMDLKNNSSGGKSLNFTMTSVGVAAGSVAGLPLAAGQTFTTVAVTDLGRLVYTTVSPSSNATVDPGLTSYEIWRLQAVSTNQDMEVRKLNFTIVGSVSVGDLKNFSLWQGGTQVGTTIPEMSAGKTVSFDLSATPYVVTKGQTKIFNVKADIVGGTNRTFRASLQNDRDVVTFDKEYKVFVKANGADSFTIVEPASSGTAVNYTINTGTLTQSSSTTTPTGNIPDGATNVTLVEFEWKANGEDIKVTSLTASSTSSDVTNILANMRLLVDGSQVGTTDSSVTADGGATTAGQSSFGSFGNSFIIKSGKTVKVKVVADLTDSTVAAGETFFTGLAAGSSNAQGIVSLTSISSVRQTGSTLTARAGTVTTAKNSSLGDRSATNPTGPVNATAVRVASFTITAGSGEAVEVSQVTLRDDNASTCVGTYMQNLVLKNAAGVQLGATVSNPSTTCTTQNSFTFNVSPAITIETGAQYVVDVFADLKASLTTATSLFDVDSITAAGKNTGTSATASSQNLSLQASYISSVGTITVALDSDTPLATNMLMGAVEQSLAKFKLTAGNAEAINLTTFVVSAAVSTTATNATGTIRNLKLVDETGAQIGTTVPSLETRSTTTFNNAVFQSLSLKVPKGQSKVITVKADITPYEVGGFTVTGHPLQLAILTDDTDDDDSGDQFSLVGTGDLSGTAITLAEMTFTSSSPAFALTDAERGSNSQFVRQVFPAAAQNQVRANEHVLYRTKLSIAWASDAPSGAAAANVAQQVAKFTVTNQANVANYDATVKAVNFSISTSISNTANRAMNIYKDSLSTTALLTTSWITASGNIGENFGNTAITDAGFTDVLVSSGATKTFFVTLDSTNAASAKTLSLAIPSSHTAGSSVAGGTFYGITWSDGVTANIVAHDNLLPLTYKTFTY